MGTSEPAPAVKSDVELARENMRKKMGKKGKKKAAVIEEVCPVSIKHCTFLLRLISTST